jgi:hypothetical protein
MTARLARQGSFKITIGQLPSVKAPKRMLQSRLSRLGVVYVYGGQLLAAYLGHRRRRHSQCECYRPLQRLCRDKFGLV